MRKQQKKTRTVIDALDLGRLDFHFLDIPLYSFNYQIEKEEKKIDKNKKQKGGKRKCRRKVGHPWPMSSSCSCA
jgi:hypothetical protein